MKVYGPWISGKDYHPESFYVKLRLPLKNGEFFYPRILKSTFTDINYAAYFGAGIDLNNYFASYFTSVKEAQNRMDEFLKERDYLLLDTMEDYEKFKALL